MLNVTISSNKILIIEISLHSSFIPSLQFAFCSSLNRAIVLMIPVYPKYFLKAGHELVNVIHLESNLRFTGVRKARKS